MTDEQPGNSEQNVDPKPSFATNAGDSERVADALNSLIGHRLQLWNEPFELAIATGYFNPDGFNLLADVLEEVGEVRLLLGAEPKSPERAIRPLDPDNPPHRAEKARLRRALQGHLHDIRQDRDLLGFELAADTRARRLVDWLQSGRVEVRRLESRFLHGKAFLITTHDEGVMAGSSNFTYAGLAVNSELNLGHYDAHVVRQVKDWFEQQWSEAEPFDLAAIYEGRYERHNPYLIYLRMLFERYGQELEEETEAGKTAGMHLTTFQEDGVWRASRILDAFGGVLVADGVGLGKSFIGGEIVRRVSDENRQRVLIVAPAALRDGMWRAFLEEHDFSRRVKVVSYEELSNDRRLNERADGIGVDMELDDIALVMIDEAHAYRNPDTIRAQVLRRLLAGTPRKQIVLLTATPVNNSLWDLYYLLAYFIQNDAAFADAGIRSLRDHFAGAMAEDPEDLSPKRLFDVLDAVSVRRTRRFVKRYYPHETISMGGLSMQIRFPEPKVEDVTYDLDDVLPGFFPRFAHALSYQMEEDAEAAQAAEFGQLTLARYAPSRYLRTGAAETRELQLAGLLRSGLLKRFESSAYAFARTCRKMAASHAAFLEALDRGIVASGRALDEWIATDTDELDSYWEGREARFREGEDNASLYQVDALRADVERDRELLIELAEEAEQVSNAEDPKLDALVAELEQIVENADLDAVGDQNVRNHRKVIVFSYYTDSIEWIRRRLEPELESNPNLAAYKDRLVVISGSEGDKKDVLFGFAPESANAPRGLDEDRYDVLLSTDVLAEGVNLQQARHIINYDLPWNPMRLVQRHGRIDRIGSQYDEVYLHCFFPDRQLDGLLGLEERLHRKIAQAAAAVGIEGQVIPGSRVQDVNFAETRSEIEKLRKKDATLFKEAGETGGALSGEHYRQELREGLSDHYEEDMIRQLPWGSGSGMEGDGPPRLVFCARVGDHHNPIFRQVSFNELGESALASETLTCLASARATPDTPRELSDDMHRLAYQAWAIAKQDILDEWLRATDPANLLPSIPKAMRDAAALLRDHAPADRSRDEIEHALDAIEAPYPVRIQNMVREAMRSSENEVEQAEAVLEVVRELGLKPSPPPKPLPVIDEHDINLVCWMAITPPNAGPGPEGWELPEQLSFKPDEQLELADRTLP